MSAYVGIFGATRHPLEFQRSLIGQCPLVTPPVHLSLVRTMVK